MVEEVLRGIFRLEIPIPKSPLKATNAYLIKGEERNLLIDTGQNCRESLEAMKSGLNKLAVDMNKTDIFLTHLHADHSGLVPLLKTHSSRIFASAPDAEIINVILTADSPMDFLLRAAHRNGFAFEEARMAINRHPANERGSRTPLQFSHIAEGMILSVGEYQLSCISTPGHTKGHTCLYDANQEVLFAGDHILGDISPNITCWDNGNPLEEFLISLKNVSALSIKLVMPGHRRIFSNCHCRIGELEEHHRQRTEEAFNILASGPLTGYQVAARMTWDMVYRSWDEVAATQKFFATGEALAHLRFLEDQGRVRQGILGEQVIYHR